MHVADFHALLYTLLKEKGCTLPFAQITESSSFISQGILDSMDFVQLLLALEEHTGTRIDFGNTEVSSLMTVQGLTGLFCKEAVNAHRTL